MHRLPTLLGAAALALGLAAPAATAANIEPVANIKYGPGTDIEFATFTIDGVEKRFALGGTYQKGLQIVDITDPTQPEVAAVYDCAISQGDVQFFRRDDLGGRAFVTYTHDDGYSFGRNSQCGEEARDLGYNPTAQGGTFIAEITDPYNPVTVSFIKQDQGSHNGTVHPSGKFFYNSNSDLITSLQPAIEITDITDPAAPKPAGEIALTTFPGLGTESHDITFADDGKRAYVAALSHAEILDTTDPAKPTSIGKIFDPAINVWHQSDPVTIDHPVLGERTFVVIEDEVAGAQGTGQCPNGGVHVYDATGPLEAAPVKVGYWNITDVGLTTNDTLGTCTAHVFDIHEKEALMTIAYYNGGVRVVDLSGLVGVSLGNAGVGMKELGSLRFGDSDTWSVKAPVVSRSGFYLYGNDQARGFDVYRYKPSATTTSSGTWMTPEQQLQAASRLKGKPKLAAICLLGTNKRAKLRSAVRAAGLKL